MCWVHDDDTDDLVTGWGWLSAATALGSAAAGGAMLTYSGFTTRALANLPAPEGVAAMQQMNAEAPRSATFMAVMFAPGLLAGVIAVRALVRRDPAALPASIGALALLAGVIGTTAFFHVPRNDALAAMDPGAAAAQWQDWLTSWVRGNHVRVVSAFVGAVALWVAAD